MSDPTNNFIVDETKKRPFNSESSRSPSLVRTLLAEEGQKSTYYDSDLNQRNGVCPSGNGSILEGYVPSRDTQRSFFKKTTERGNNHNFIPDGSFDPNGTHYILTEPHLRRENVENKSLVICIHGLDAYNIYFKELSSFLVQQLNNNTNSSKEYSILRYDTLGCGHSHAPKYGYLYNAENFVKQLRDLYIHISNKSIESRYDEVILIGHSFGGALATVYASQFKNEVSKVILISPAGLLEKVNPWLDMGRECGWILGSNITRYVQYKTVQRSIARGEKLIEDYESQITNEEYTADICQDCKVDPNQAYGSKLLSKRIEVDFLRGQAIERKMNKTSFKTNVAMVKWAPLMGIEKCIWALLPPNRDYQPPSHAERSRKKESFPGSLQTNGPKVYLVWGTKDKLANYTICFPKWYSILSCKDRSLYPNDIYGEINEHSATLSQYKDNHGEELDNDNTDMNYIYSPPSIRQYHLWGRWFIGLFHILTCMMFYKCWRQELAFSDIDDKDLKKEEKKREERRQVLEKKVTQLDLQYLRENSFFGKRIKRTKDNLQQEETDTFPSYSLNKLISIEDDNFFDYDIVEGGGHNILLTNQFVSEQISEYIQRKQ